MDLKCFLLELESLNKYIDDFLIFIHENQRIDQEKLQVLMQYLDKIIPKWIFFIEQTEIGTVENLNQTLTDIEYGIENDDIVYFMDTLCNGIGTLAVQYIDVITEAVYEE